MSTTTTTRRRPRSPPLMYNMGMGMLDSGNGKAPRPLIKLDKQKGKSPQSLSPAAKSPSSSTLSFGSRKRTTSGVSSGSGGSRSHGGSNTPATSGSVVSSVFRSLRRHTSTSQSSMNSQASNASKDTLPVSPVSDNLESIPEASTSSHNKASRVLGTELRPRNRPTYPASTVSMASSIEPMEFAPPPTPPPQRKHTARKPISELQSENATRQLQALDSTTFAGQSSSSSSNPPVLLSRPPKGHRRPKTAPSSASSGSGDYGTLRRALPADIPLTPVSTRLSHRSRPSTSSSLSFSPLHFFQSKREPEPTPAAHQSVEDFGYHQPRSESPSLSSQSTGVAESDIMIISRHHVPPPSPPVVKDFAAAVPSKQPEHKEISSLRRNRSIPDHHRSSLPPKPLVVSFPSAFDKQTLAEPPPFQFTLVQTDEEDERKEKPAEEFVLMPAEPSTTRRREAVWSGEWNQRDMQDVISKLRNLR